MSYEVLSIVVQELQKFGSPNIVMALVGNKTDLCASRKVAVEVSILVNTLLIILF